MYVNLAKIQQVLCDKEKPYDAQQAATKKGAACCVFYIPEKTGITIWQQTY